jgi:hypothetical protein
MNKGQSFHPSSFILSPSSFILSLCRRRAPWCSLRKMTRETLRELFRPRLCAAACLALFFAAAGAGQSGRPAAKQAGAGVAPTPAPKVLLKRTTTRREVRTFGYGGTLTVYGAPVGSITVEAWPRAEVELIAEIELQAETAEDLARLAEVNGFVLSEDLNHLRVLTVGTHDRQYMKRAARGLPKRLLGLPWKVDYRLRVPAATDLEIYAGRGALTLSGVDGAARLNAGEGAATLAPAGGDLEATIAGGPVTVRIPSRSWRGRGVSVRLARGDLTIELPAAFNGDLDAEVLRVGRVENLYPALAPRDGAKPTDRALRARAGAGGAPLKFTVGDGNLRIVQANSSKQ